VFLTYNPSVKPCLLMCLLAVASNCNAQAATPAPTAIWTKEFVSELDRSVVSSEQGGGVAFLDNDRVIVYATEPMGHFPRPEGKVYPSAYLFRLSLLDTHAGEVILTREWTTRRELPEVLPTSGGVLVRSGGQLLMYTKDFASTRTLPVQLEKSNFAVNVSTSGKSFAICRPVRRDNDQDARGWSHCDVIDAENLQVRFSWEERPRFHVAITDESFYEMADQILRQTSLADPHVSKVIADYRKVRGCAAGTAMVLGSDGVLLARDCDKIRSLTPDGTATLLEPYDGKGSKRVFAAKCGITLSPMTRLTAAASPAPITALTLPVITADTHGFLTEWDYCLTRLPIAVYDTRRKRRILTLDVDPPPTAIYGIALSPDGSKLVVLNDRSVSLYAVAH
jgi:hypothetical protein